MTTLEQAATRVIVKGGIRQPHPVPSAPRPTVEATCDPTLSFGELLVLHMRRGTGHPADQPWAPKVLEVALGYLASSYAVRAWCVGRALPTPTQFDLLLVQFQRSSPSSLPPSHGSNAAANATGCATTVVDTPGHEVGWQEVLRAAWLRGNAARDAELAIPEAWETQARLEGVWWLHQRGQTLNDVGERFAISRERVRQLLNHREDRLRDESRTLQHLAPLLKAMVPAPL